MIVRLREDSPLPPHPWRSLGAGSPDVVEDEGPCDLILGETYRVICEQGDFLRVVGSSGFDSLYPRDCFVVEDAAPSRLGVRYGMRWRFGCASFESFFSSLYETHAVVFTPLPEDLDWATWLVMGGSDWPCDLEILAERGLDEALSMVAEVAATGELDVSHFYPEDQMGSELTREQWLAAGSPMRMGDSCLLAERGRMR